MEYNHLAVDLYESIGIRDKFKDIIAKVNKLAEECQQPDGNHISKLIERLVNEAKEDEALLRFLIAESVIANSEEDEDGI